MYIAADLGLAYNACRSLMMEQVPLDSQGIDFVPESRWAILYGEQDAHDQRHGVILYQMYDKVALTH